MIIRNWLGVEVDLPARFFLEGQIDFEFGKHLFPNFGVMQIRLLVGNQHLTCDEYNIPTPNKLIIPLLVLIGRNCPELRPFTCKVLQLQLVVVRLHFRLVLRQSHKPSTRYMHQLKHWVKRQFHPLTFLNDVHVVFVFVQYLQHSIPEFQVPIPCPFRNWVVYQSNRIVFVVYSLFLLSLLILLLLHH